MVRAPSNFTIMSGTVNNALSRFQLRYCCFCHDRKCLQSINFPECTLCSEVSRFFSSWLRNPARGRVVVDALVIPGLYSSIKRVGNLKAQYTNRENTEKNIQEILQKLILIFRRLYFVHKTTPYMLCRYQGGLHLPNTCLIHQ